MAIVSLILLLVVCNSLAESTDCKCKCMNIDQPSEHLSGNKTLILKCEFSGSKTVKTLTIHWFWKPPSRAMQVLLCNNSTYQQRNSDLNDAEKNFWESELHFTQLNHNSAGIYYCCIQLPSDTQLNASNINLQLKSLPAHQSGICHEPEGQKTCADFNFSDGEPQNPAKCIQTPYTPALHSTPALHGTPALHSTPSPTEGPQPSGHGTNGEKNFPPVALTYSAIVFAVVFLLTTLLTTAALAVLIRTKVTEAARTQGDQQYPMVACSGDHNMPQSEHQTDRWRQSCEETTLHTGSGNNSDEFHPYDVLTLRRSICDSSVNKSNLPLGDSEHQSTKHIESATTEMEGAHIYQTLEPVTMDEEDNTCSHLNITCKHSNESFPI